MAQPPERSQPQVYQFRNIEPPTRSDGERGNAPQTPALSTNYQSWKNQTDQNAAKTASNSAFSGNSSNSRYGSSFSRPLDGSRTSNPPTARQNFSSAQQPADSRPQQNESFFRQSSSFRSFNNQSATVPQQNIPPIQSNKQTFNTFNNNNNTNNNNNNNNNKQITNTLYNKPQTITPSNPSNIPTSGGYVPARIKAQRDADEKRQEEEKLQAEEEKKRLLQEKQLENEKKMEAAKKPAADQIRLQRVALLKKQVQFYLGNELKELAELMSTACILKVQKLADGKENREYMDEMRAFYSDRPGAHTYRRPELCEEVEKYIDEKSIEWDISHLRGDLIGMDESDIGICLRDWGFWRRCIKGKEEHSVVLPELLEEDVKRAFWPAVSMIPIQLCAGIIVKYIVVAASCAKSAGGGVQNPLSIVRELFGSGNGFFALLLSDSGIANVEQLALTEIGLLCAKLGCPALGNKWALIEAIFDVALSQQLFSKKSLLLWTQGHGKDFHGRADLLMQLRYWRQWVENPESLAPQEDEPQLDAEKRTDPIA